jgi:hypothetical protein
MNGALRSWMRRQPTEVVSFHPYSGHGLWCAPKGRLPPTPVAIFRGLGMSMNAIAAYFRRFPDFHHS